MFTGIVEHVGTVLSIPPLDASSPVVDGFSLLIGDSHPILGDCHVGDSICVNGACLTVTEFDSEGGVFKVGLAPETLDRTDLGDLKEGSKVNLERAMAPSGRYGGHIVQGHIDTTATISSIHVDGNSLRLVFTLHASSPFSYTLFLIPKGYITLDGISLTLTSTPTPSSPLTFGVMLIAHTQEKVVLSRKKVGDRVNVEFDVVAKGIEKVVSGILGKANTEGEEEGEGFPAFEVMVGKAVERALEKRVGKFDPGCDSIPNPACL